FEITKRLVERYPKGPLFRNADGGQWDKETVGRRFARKRKKLGRRYCLYGFRHSFAQRLLLAGVDPMTVAVFARTVQHEHARLALQPSLQGRGAFASGTQSRVRCFRGRERTGAGASPFGSAAFRSRYAVIAPSGTRRTPRPFAMRTWPSSFRAITE